MQSPDHAPDRSPGHAHGGGRRLDPLSSLRARLETEQAVVAGVLSGTSGDGIDVALVRFVRVPGTAAPGRPDPIAFATLPFPDDLAPRVRAILDGVAPSLAEVAFLDRDLGRAFGRAARQLADEHDLPLDLVASHGQTVWHHDGHRAEGAATLQLGDGCACAEAAGCAVASDFRRRDIAAGGEGAPLSALADEQVFPLTARPAHILNLGGMSNLTCLPRQGEGALLAFDTGPCGSLLDGFTRRLLRQPLDSGGAHAAGGTCHQELLEAWLAHPFLQLAPPKSTGRDTFGEDWIDGLLATVGGVPSEDLLRTAVELVAECVAIGLRRFAPGDRTVPLVLAGGGIHNRTLVAALARRTGLEPLSASEFGVDPDAREALVFAVLGARLALGIPSSDPRCSAATGARGGRVLGKLSLPAPESDLNSLD